MALIIGHRGDSSSFPENTIEAFVGAAESGADWVELDVRRTADGEIVVHHDAATSQGDVIADTPAADLPSAVPTLGQALDACGDMGVNIEIKNDPADVDYDPEHLMVPRVIEVARAHLTPDRMLITSFDMGAINAVHDVAPSIPTGFLTDEDLGAEVAVGRAAAHDHVAINPADSIVTPRWIAEAANAGLAVYVWTVDDPGRMIELVEMGVDGIITNNPALAVKTLR